MSVLTHILVALVAVGLSLAPSGGSLWARQATPVAGLAVQVAASELRVTDQRRIDAGGRIIALSPDGGRLAAFTGLDDDILCIHELLQDPAPAPLCVDLMAGDRPVISVDFDRAVWSPDGSRLAFTERGPEFLHDSDVWVLDAVTGELTNLTDDGFIGPVRPFGNGEPFAMDYLPAWSPDGNEIAFVRSAWADGDWDGTRLMRVSVAGGEPLEILRVTPEEPMTVYFRMAYTPDGARLVYTYSVPNVGDPANGIWVVDLDGANQRQLAGWVDDELGYPELQQVSPRGDKALVVFLNVIGDYVTYGSPFGLLDLATGEVTRLELLDPDAPPYAYPNVMTFSPDGSKLLYSVGPTNQEDRLLVRDLDGSEEHILFEPVKAIPLGRNYGIVWSSNGHVFVPDDLATGLLLTVEPVLALPVLTTPTPATPTPVAASPVAMAGPIDPADVEAGTALIVNDAVAAVRSAPSVEAPVVTELSQGAEVIALGPAETGDGFTWVPVRDPATGTIGYVRAELLSAA